MPTTLEITESVTNVTVANSTSTEITVDTTSATVVSINPSAIPTVDAGAISVTPHNTVTATSDKEQLNNLLISSFEEQLLPQQAQQIYLKVISFMTLMMTS